MPKMGHTDAIDSKAKELRISLFSNTHHKCFIDESIFGSLCNWLMWLWAHAHTGVTFKGYSSWRPLGHSARCSCVT